MKKITIIKRLDKYRHSPEKINSRVILFDKELIFEDRAKQQVIIVDTDTGIVRFFLTYYDNTTKHFRFEEGSFSKDELIMFSQALNFEVIPHKYHSGILMGSLGSINKAYEMNCYGAVVRCNEKYYLLVFARRGCTNFEENIIYIHGIWQVELSEGFKNKLFII